MLMVKRPVFIYLYRYNICKQFILQIRRLRIKIYLHYNHVNQETSMLEHVTDYILILYFIVIYSYRHVIAIKLIVI